MFHPKDVVFEKPSIFQPGIEEYAERHSTAPTDACADLHRDTYLTCPEWANIATSSGQLSLMTMLIQLVRARRVLEIGTFTGHGTLGIAAALPEDGEVVTVDNFAADIRARDVATKSFAASAWSHKITLIEDEASTALNTVSGEFDMIFVDADKPNYLSYYELILQRRLLAPEGLLVFDNTLWGGIVLEADVPVEPVPPHTSGQPWLEHMVREWGGHVREFNSRVQDDSRVDNVILTVRDGMTLIKLRPDDSER